MKKSINGKNIQKAKPSKTKFSKKSQKSKYHYDKEEDFEIEANEKLKNEIEDLEDEEIFENSEPMEIDNKNKAYRKKLKNINKQTQKGNKRITNKKKLNEENNEHIDNETINLSLEEQELNSEDKSFSDKSAYELTKNERTLIIKNLQKTIDEEDLKQFIEENSPNVEIEDIRVVRDKKGFSKGFAFVDFADKNYAEICLNDINGKKLEEEYICCAISKPPSSG